MNVNDAIFSIRQQRQAFAYGIEAIDNTLNTGVENDPLRKLSTKTDADPVYPSAIVGPQINTHPQLARAASNQLAMQLIVGVTQQVKQVRQHWPEDPHPTIRSLRLVRNGVAHGNRVSYNSKDPRPKTVWCGLEFTNEIEGDQLFTQPEEYIWNTNEVNMIEGHLEAGDGLALTTDILEILIEESDKFSEGNIVGLSRDAPPEWEEV